MNRTAKTTELLDALASVVNLMDEIKGNRKETLAALAICEIITGLPIHWFSNAERMMVVQVMRELHGNPSKMIQDIMDQKISYVELATNGEKHADDLCEAMKELHEQEFGSV